jgi:dihydrofolate synthase/folylpolyglutamate synthase
MDHMDYLGDTLEEIAAEKAGIISADQIVVVAQQPPVALEVISERAAAVGATVAMEGAQFGVLDRRVGVGGQLITVQGLAGVYPDLFVPLHGEHQAHNAACAVVAVEAFLGGGSRMLDLEPLQSGLQDAEAPGRLEVVRRNPTVLVDAAHNPAGAATLAAALREAFDFGRLVGVVAVLADKDAEGILVALEPALDAVVVTRSSSPRAMDPEALASLAADVFGAERVSVQPVLSRAIEEAVEQAETDLPLGSAGVVVAGSVTAAGEARALLQA